MSEWISVKDQLPTESGKYIICAVEAERFRHVSIAYFGRRFQMTGRMAYWKVTHWMPLPNLPNSEHG